LSAQALSQRLLGHECFELSDEVGVAGEGEVGFDSLLEGGESQLLEAGDLSLCEGLVLDVGEDWSTPERKRGSENACGLGRTALDQRTSPLGEESLE
jgi:hypothetical protein